MSKVRLAPSIMFQFGTLLDGGDTLEAGPTFNGEVPLSQLAGCAFYDELVAKLPEIQAQVDAQTPPAPPTPNRAARRANGKAKTSA